MELNGRNYIKKSEVGNLFPGYNDIIQMSRLQPPWIKFDKDGEEYIEEQTLKSWAAWVQRNSLIRTQGDNAKERKGNAFRQF